MAECPHDWQRKPDALKERCSLCGAARPYDENRCNHEWKPRADGTKEGCAKCGAARVVLMVDNVTQKHDAPEVK